MRYFAIGYSNEIFILHSRLKCIKLTLVLVILHLDALVYGFNTFKGGNRFSHNPPVAQE